MSGLLAIADGDGHRVLRLDRPERGNALCDELIDELNAALDSALADSVPLIVFAGAGRHFCTGFDLSAVETRSDGDLLASFVRIEILLDRIWSIPLPTLAIAKGRTMGAGADLFTACRHRIACEDANFAFPGANFGIVLGTQRLGQRIGATAASELIGRSPIDAQQALAIGLAQQVIVADREHQAIAQASKEAGRLPLEVRRRIDDALFGAAQSDSDLAALVRSAIPRGLGQRISNYKAGLDRRSNRSDQPI